MFRLGIVSELGAGENLGFARVLFDDSGMSSHWLALPSVNTLNTKHWVPVEVKTQVLCLMDPQCEQGGIVMALWSEKDKPPGWAGENTAGIQFPDGTEVFYDWKKKTLTVNAPDAELNIKCKKLNVDSDMFVTGEVTAGPTKIKLTEHTHTSAVGPTGPPIPTPTP